MPVSSATASTGGPTCSSRSTSSSEALRRAADDSGAGDAALTGADAVHTVGLLSWRYRDPAALVGERVGATPKATSVTGMGGNGPQSLVNLTCLAIQRGDADLVLLGGAEAWRTRMGARSAGADLDWTVQDDDRCPRRPGRSPRCRCRRPASRPAA